MTAEFNIAMPADLLSRALQEWDRTRDLPPEQRTEALRLADHALATHNARQTAKAQETAK